MLKSRTNRPLWVAYLVVLALVLGFFVLAQALQGSAAHPLLIKEGGVVETLSAVGYLLCVLLLAAQGGAVALRRQWPIVVILLICAARELDFDKRFTAVGIFKSKFLVSPEVSLGVKLIGLTVILFLLFTLVTILRRHARGFLKNLLSPTIFEVAIVTAGVFLVVSKTLDGLARKLRGIVEISPQVNALTSHLEEALEFGVPCLFAIAILSCFGRKRQAGPS